MENGRVIKCSEVVDLRIPCAKRANREGVDDLPCSALPLKRALLLGMVYALEQKKNRGQEGRDRVRCLAMENRGVVVNTLDDKHEQNRAMSGRHCCTSFTDRHLAKALENQLGIGIKFDFVFLDYFFSPVGWARTRWTDSLYEDTIPNLAEGGFLAKGGQIWLPNLHCVEVSLAAFSKKLEQFYTIREVQDLNENLLYQATQDVEDVLLLFPDAICNATQNVHLLKRSQEGASTFIVLELRDEFIKKPTAKLKVNKSAKQGGNTKYQKRKAQVILKKKEAGIVRDVGLANERPAQEVAHLEWVKEWNLSLTKLIPASVTLKLCFAGEIRRFSINREELIFSSLLSTISDLFPSLLCGQFDLLWKDDEGDLISVKTNPELLEAVRLMTNPVGGVAKFHVHVQRC